MKKILKNLLRSLGTVTPAMLAMTVFLPGTNGSTSGSGQLPTSELIKTLSEYLDDAEKYLNEATIDKSRISEALIKLQRADQVSSYLPLHTKISENLLNRKAALWQRYTKISNR